MTDHFTEKNKYRLLRAGALLLAMFFLILCPAEEIPAAPGYEHVARDTAGSKQTRLYGMTPVHGTYVENGTYDVALKSSSKYFRVSDARLQVQDGQMQVTFTLESHAYEYVYPGTGAEAAEAALEAYIPCEETDSGSTVTIEVPALDETFPCAAFSKRREKWYDRLLLVRADSLPPDALRVQLPDYELIEDALDAYGETHPDEVQAALDAAEAAAGSRQTAAGTEEAAGGEQAAYGRDTGTEETDVSGADAPVSEVIAQVDEAVMDALTDAGEAAPVNKPDGVYAVEVTMTGGSGRASVSSPTWLIVNNGAGFAKLLWSSTYYDYMIVNDRKYLNMTTDGGNSTFIIPIEAFDEPMEVIADTTAMGDPVAIEYGLTFYEESIGSKGQIPQEAAKKVLITAFLIMVIGGVINHFVKKRRQK